MRRIRFTIAGLLGVILVLGIGFAALRESSDLWESGLFTLTLGVMLISILLSIHRAGKRRGFWIGFALFGSAYLGMSLVPSIEPRLMTTKALAYLDSKVPGRSKVTFTVRLSGTGLGPPGNRVQNVAFAPNGSVLATSSPGQVRVWSVATGKLLGGWSGTSENFVKIGHSLFALLAGWLGGQLSRRLYRSSRMHESSTDVDVEGNNP